MDYIRNWLRYLEDIIIDDDYKLNDTLDGWEQIKLYIMRYRRIIGIILLIILISIMYYCDDLNYDKEDNIQNGGSNDNVYAKYEAKFKEKNDEAAARKKYDEKKMEEAKEQRKIKAEEIKKKYDAEHSKKGKAYQLSKLAKEADIKEQLGQVKDKLGDKFAKSKLGKYQAGLEDEKKQLIEQGLSVGKANQIIRAQRLSDVKNFVGEKVSQFANWLYELLFAVAISIAICMVIFPSIAFVILGIVCYILLRKQMSKLKGI